MISLKLIKLLQRTTEHGISTQTLNNKFYIYNFLNPNLGIDIKEF